MQKDYKTCQRNGTKTRTCTDLCVPICGAFRYPSPCRVAEVDVVEAELFIVPYPPLEVVHERPGRVAPYVTPVQLDGCRGW